MSKWDKLIERILTLSSDVRFEELKKVLEFYGYCAKFPRGGSSHCVFRKTGCPSIVVPIHKPIKVAYLKIIRDVVLEMEKDE